MVERTNKYDGSEGVQEGKRLELAQADPSRRLSDLTNGPEDGEIDNGVNVSEHQRDYRITDGSIHSNGTGSRSRSSRNEEIVKPDGPFANEFRFICGKFINNEYIENFITFVIFCNTALLILSTFDFVRDNKTAKHTANQIDTVFLGIFTAESALQLIYRDIKLFKNSWLTFDFLLVMVSWAFPTATVLRSLRILKIASKFEALQKLIKALLEVIPNITAIFSLLLLVFYIFAVMFTTLFKDLELGEDYFSRLDKTLFSLFQFMTMDWQEAARDVQKHMPWAPILFVVFEIVSGFIVFNLIVAVLCEALGLLEKDPEEDALNKKMEQERIDAMNALLNKVESIKEHQIKIQRTLKEISHSN